MPEKPQRDRKALPGVETEEPEFRELTKLRAFDRQQHIQKSLEAGLPREKAEAHAEDDLQERERGSDDARP